MHRVTASVGSLEAQLEAMSDPEAAGMCSPYVVAETCRRSLDMIRDLERALGRLDSKCLRRFELLRQIAEMASGETAPEPPKGAEPEKKGRE